MQFDVFQNPLPRARRVYPFVLILQSDFADTGNDRVVAFLFPRPAAPGVVGRLTPIVEVNGRPFIVLFSSLTSLPATSLRAPVDNLASYRDKLIEALDWLFLGV